MARGEPESPLERLASKLDCEWPHIARAKTLTLQKRDSLRELVSTPTPADSEDRSVVAFGSIARLEFTDHSDLDWTLLIDGRANTKDLLVAQEIGRRFKAEFRDPGRTGVFGTMVFSHELVHHIGGEDDSNKNLTRRMLLLLESICLGSEAQAYDRAVRQVLERYVDEEVSLRRSDCEPRPPRFLLNDIARFWRTMAVDFATKQRERQSEHWGLKNIKLRFARKLLFASGLLLCYRCVLEPPAASEAPDYRDALLTQLEGLVHATPLNIIAEAVLSCRIEKAGRKIFDAYDKYLQLVGSKASREELKNVRPETAAQSEVFQEARELSHSFQDGLTELFFDRRLGKLTREYGIF